MSMLIDCVSDENQACIKGKWYIAKPLSYPSILSLLSRLRDAIRIITGKSIAVHYKEDERK